MTTAFDNPARRSFVTEMVPVGDIKNAASLNSALMTLVAVFGPFLAGLLLATVGFGWAFLADGLSYIAVLVALRRCAPASSARSAAMPGPRVRCARACATHAASPSCGSRS